MTRFHQTTLAVAVAAILGNATAMAETQERPVPPTLADVYPPQVERPVQPKHANHAAPVIPAQELPILTATTPNAGFAESSAFTNKVASGVATPGVATPGATGTTLTPPIAMSYAGNSVVLAIQNTGTNRGVSSVTLNPSNPVSALYGQTNGSGAGLTGYNYGTVGPAGKFGVVNTSNPQVAVFGTTNGVGSAILGTITGASNNQPAILGQNTATADYGIGVEGVANNIGVFGSTTDGFAAVYGTTTTGNGVVGSSSSGTGVLGSSYSGIGVYGYSTSTYGLYALSSSGEGVYGSSLSSYGMHAETKSGSAGIYVNNAGGGRGITAHTASGIGVYASSDTGYGVWGQSTNAYGVIGEDSGSGSGVYGYSATGYAGNFVGKVAATSYITTSDRNAKTNFHPIDNQSILDRVERLPITSWDFKSDLNKHHVGPMAQDFHAAFGLDGMDDKHINLTDAVGVSLASIQALGRAMKTKDAQIAKLTAELADQRATTATVLARMTVLEQQHATATQTTSFLVQGNP